MYYTIRTLTQKGLSQRRIARELGIHRETVRKIQHELAEGRMDPVPVKRDKLLDPWEEQIIEQLEKGWSAELIYQWLTNRKQVNVSYPTVARYVRGVTHPEVFVPMVCGPGEEIQVDFGYFGTFLKAGRMVKVWCFAMILSHSRYGWWELVTNQTVPTFIRCHIHGFEYFGGASLSVLLDNLKAGVIHPSFYEPVFQHQYAEMLAHYGAGPVAARPRRPQDKGKVESGVKYAKNNFLPPNRDLTYEQLETALREWTDQIANRRTHGTTRKVPAEVWTQTERPALQALPDQRYQIWEIQQRKVDRFAHIAFRYNYYSVPARHCGETLAVHCNESLVEIYQGTRKIAVHPLCSDQGRYISRDEHRPSGKLRKTRAFYAEKMEAIGPAAQAFMEAIEADRPMHWHEMCKGVISLADKWPPEEVDASCQRALCYGAHSYREVKSILEGELWKQPTGQTPPRQRPVTSGHGHPLGIYDQLTQPREVSHGRH